MPRKNNRKPEIITALAKGADPIKVADDFGVTHSYVYHLDKKRREGFANKTAVVSIPKMVGGPLFKQLSVSSLKRHGNDIAEEYLRELQGLQGVQLYKEMGNDPVVAAVLQAVKMTLRRVQWFASPPKSGREQDVDFLNECLDDMSITFVDTIDQILSMLQYGFAPFEKIYKLRRGDGMGRPGPRTAVSRYNDGKIGWRKFELIGQDTLAPGNMWIFDEEDGSLLGCNQLPPAGVLLKAGNYNFIEIPIEKMVLFRTTTERNNPEGRSLLRAMYSSWYYSKNLTEIEAISAERMGAGFPVVYLGDDISKGVSADAEINEYRKLVRNIRVDEQMGVVIPSAKMGFGAREGQGVVLEFLSPTGRTQVNFGQIVERHEKRMAMVGLAQFIHLGMGQYGSQSLATVTQDFFHLAVGAWADAVRDTLNRFAVIPLLQLNRMNVTEPVLIDHGSVSPPNLAEVADYINKTVGAKVIEPDDQLEASLRRMAGFPDKDIATVRTVMTELDGDGGTRMNRGERTTVDTAKTEKGVKAGEDGKPANQRNMRPKADKPQEAKGLEAKKPMRASEDNSADEFVSNIDNNAYQSSPQQVIFNVQMPEQKSIEHTPINIPVNVTAQMPEQPQPHVFVNVDVPETPVPQVNNVVNVPADNHNLVVNVPQQSAPVVTVTVPPESIKVDVQTQLHSYKHRTEKQVSKVIRDSDGKVEGQQSISKVTYHDEEEDEVK